MRIIATPEYAVNIILGVFGGTSFYVGVKQGDDKDGFDKIVFERSEWTLEEWNNRRDDIVLVNKIGARWNRGRLASFTEWLFSRSTRTFLQKFFNAKSEFNGNYNEVEKKVKWIVEATQENNYQCQNTRVSKILHILAPKLIPMIDPEQGTFILLGNENYAETNRGHLIEAFKKFHEDFSDKENEDTIKKISEQLKEHKIEITKLRIFELLIWLQTQYNKKFNKEKSPVCLICHGGVI